MKHVVLALAAALVPVCAQAGDLYRWTDAGGVVHYTNVAQNAPAEAVQVDTPITLEVERLPAGDEPVLEMAGGQVSERCTRAHGAPAVEGQYWYPDAPRIYDEERLRFGLFSSGALYFGGFSHANDISPNLNIYAFTLGPEAWLNAAKAELAMREHGINPRDMMRLYQEAQR
ncbi:MAG TPA: DUF4124 domain-containing protein [Candidatus Limnocylindria bacterium]|nr:DUF4124 domain-containing protein [Candidatus Limnocylindria bacterium]